MTRREFVAAGAALMQAPARTSMGLTPDSFPMSRPPRTALEFLERAHSMGAAGVQATLASFDTGYLKRVRSRVEELGMYLEVLAPLPGEDTSAFEQIVRGAKEAGALALRSVCLSGRRYENFDSLEKWKGFVAEAKAKLARAVPIADKYRIPIGIENHKDWTIAEMVPLLKSYSSEYLRACIDFGNNVSLLDDPVDVVEALAPFAANTHVKDIAVEEYEDGFLMSEVPLGDGILDLKRMLAAVSRARPEVRFSLEMLTRDPLKIPCLTDKYWATFPDRNGRYLARALALVRKRATRLPRVTGLDREAQLRLEAENNNRSLAYGRDQLGLRP